MDDSLNMSGDLHAMVRRADGLYVHHGLVGDLEKFSDDALMGARTVYATALHALHMDAVGSAIRADALSRGLSNADAVALIPAENIKGAHHLGSGLVTTAGVNLLAADWTNATATLKLSNYHDVGTGTTAAAIGQTALVTPAGTARVAGTQSNPSAGTYQSVATISFVSSLAITEWGLFTASTVGTMWDRKTFSSISVVSGDSLQTTYSLVVTAGG